ncbi:carbonic anhydrase [Rhodonellum psychrophilum GCM71 = DSM 17998]|uniref:Carbonic anhydrase n=2 Tax=Rhodonellum TaxID=336827 RepID=U5C0L1_9BACT|nr:MULTISPECIES: carbonic anhydrase family protein [Rhodonellum]ERM81722.1 carbonic anhydrase [Rhodonellum psychrophilum GCM71 = DSM 17998]MDO9551885.1 carbonic anhydrase family protein [Rhodonellum sp.]SDZ55698.1 carbonic anhydrase [Rhodonellum ikkaensis]
MRVHTRKSQEELTPEDALQYLKEGNQRFIRNLRANRNLLQQVNETAEGQFPFAIILSCIDSRTSAELVFDQGLGDIFSARVAGNIVNEDILGSMEYAVKYAGSKLILVLGHTKCGAIISACNQVRDGNITTLLHKIKPAVEKEKTILEDRNGQNEKFVNKVAELNVRVAMKEILERSDIIAEMISNRKITLEGGVYDVETGEVNFF